MEDQVASLCGQVYLLKSELVSSLEEASQLRHEAEAKETNGLAYLPASTRWIKKAKELKQKKADYVAHLVASKKGRREANIRLSMLRARRPKRNNIWQR